LEPFLTALNAAYRPGTVVLVKPDGERASELAALAPFTEPHGMIDGLPTAYVCSGNTCNAPTTSVDKMKEQLGSGSE
jgi:uncharacterized protein YyaL (SSP411 family)